MRRLSNELIKELGLSETHCISCGKFLGFNNVCDGYAVYYCSNCKGWTVIGKDINKIEIIINNA